MDHNRWFHAFCFQGLFSFTSVYAQSLPGAGRFTGVQGDAASEAALHRGLAQLTDIFRDCLRENIEDRMRAGEWRRALRSALLLARESPRRLVTATTGGLRAAMNETLRGTRDPQTALCLSAGLPLQPCSSTVMVHSSVRVTISRVYDR